MIRMVFEVEEMNPRGTRCQAHIGVSELRVVEHMNPSIRKSIFRRSVISNVRQIAVSKFQCPGPSNVFLPVLPKVAVG